MRKISEKDTDRAIQLLTEYNIDPVVYKYFLGDSTDASLMMETLYIFYTSYYRNRIYISDDEKLAVALHSPDDQTALPTLKSLYLDFSYVIKLGLKILTRMITYQSWINGYKKKIFKVDHYYFDVLSFAHPGISFADHKLDPDMSQLKRSELSDGIMVPLIQKANNEGYPIYTDTFTTAAIPFFEEYGFAVIDSLILPGTDYTMHYLEYLNNK